MLIHVVADYEQGDLPNAEPGRRTPYRFFRRLFLVVGSIEKVDDVRSAGSIGAALTVVFTLTFPDGVSVVFVRMRIVPPKSACSA